MKFAPIVIACALAAGGSAFAQNESANAPNAQPQQSASEFGQKAKNGVHKLGDATKNAFNKLRGKAHDSTAKADAKDNTRAMGAGKSSRDRAASSGTASSSSDTADTSGSRQKRMDDAYADYQSKQGKQ